MKKILFCLSLFAAFWHTVPAQQAEELMDKRPNIIVFLTDDQGYGDLSAHGNPVLKTPHMDQFREESFRFENFYVAASCSPTRAALLTGLHHFRTGVTHTLPPLSSVSLECKLLPEYLKDAGYQTAHFGKWHVGNDGDYSPARRGFQTVVGFVGSSRVTHFDPIVYRNGKREQTTGYRTDILFDEAMAYIDEQKDTDSPFFCYLATWSPHDPLIAPEEYIAPYRDLVSPKQAAFLGMVANLDMNLGRLVEHLQKLDIAEETLIVFMNDNGATYGLDVFNADMRGCKATSWHGGNRAFSLWSWPGTITPDSIDTLTSVEDVLPTLLQVAGIEPDSVARELLDGHSLLPLLEGQSVPWAEERMLFHHVGRWAGGTAAYSKYSEAAVRENHYLLVRREPIDDPTGISEKERHASTNLLQRLSEGQNAAPYTQDAFYHWGLTDGWELYDIQKDPACQIDLSPYKPDQAATMAAAYDLWWEEVFPQMVERGGDQLLDY